MAATNYTIIRRNKENEKIVTSELKYKWTYKQALALAMESTKEMEELICVIEREYLDNVQEERVTLLISEIAKIQKEGSLAESATDVNYHTARKIEKEVENFYYEMITRRMSAEAAKESAENMLKKIGNSYRDWDPIRT